MGSLIDTSPLITIEREARGGTLDFTALGFTDGYVSTVTLSELWVGYYLARNETQRRRTELHILSSIRLFQILPFDAEAAKIRAQLLVGLRGRGISVGERDLQIAATALAHGHDVLTGNVAEFSRIPGLRVIPWVPSAP